MAQNNVFLSDKVNFFELKSNRLRDFAKRIIVRNVSTITYSLNLLLYEYLSISFLGYA